MSLSTALNVGQLALQTQTVALQTVGHNIANATTEGYTRQRVDAVAAPAQGQSFGQVGQGVAIGDIRRLVDRTLEGLIHNAEGGVNDLKAREEVLARAESIAGELGEFDLSSALSRFFDVVDEVVANPSEPGVREEFLAVAEDLAKTFRDIDEQLRAARGGVNEEIAIQVGEVNRLAEEIAGLNTEIVAAEGLGGSGSANDLRDQRDEAVRKLSELIGLKAVEQPDGAVDVFVGGEALVQGGQAQGLALEPRVDAGVSVSDIVFERSGRKLPLDGGRIAGLVGARDGAVKELQLDVDQAARTFMAEVNRVHASGVGLVTRDQVTSTNAVSSETAILDEAGLSAKIQHGSFDLKIENRLTGEITSFQIRVDLDNIASNGPTGTGDETLQSVVDQMNAQAATRFPSFKAQVTNDRRLQIATGDGSLGLYFGNDTSGFLGAMGVNTLFDGRGSTDMRLNADIRANSSLFATAFSLAEGDNASALALGNLRNAKILGGAPQVTVENFVAGAVAQLGMELNSVRDQLESQEILRTQLVNQRQSISGVSLDEEAINLVKHQRAFQGAARYISAIDEMMQTLLTM